MVATALYADQSLTAQTAYAQLLDACMAAELARSVADLPGSFNAKTVKGRKYWYFQYTEPAGKLRQVYVGPDGDPVQRLMQRKRGASAYAVLEPLARSALALGCTGVLPRHYRVVRRLADYRFFHAGGLLIGTHAFLAYANMLGVRWGAQERTQDIDFAHAGKALALALPGDIEVRTDEAIASLGMGFLPVSGLNGRGGGTYLAPAEPDFRLDFLTPSHPDHDEPYVHPQLHVTLQPLPFMEFSLEHPEQATVFCAEGAVLVNVPAPERFALHKLVVAGEREGTFRTKASKDLAQAAHLLAYLWEHRRSALEAAAEDLLRRGRGWASRFDRGVQSLAKAYADLPAVAALQGMTAGVARR
jgi:hypothetical protein